MTFEGSSQQETGSDKAKLNQEVKLSEFKGKRRVLIIELICFQ